ncbi:unnamed protein product [Calypogeia fissa]
MADDNKKKGGSGGKKKPVAKPTKNPRMFANKKMRDAYLIQIALKLVMDVAKAAREAKAAKDLPPPAPKDPPQ